MLPSDKFDVEAVAQIEHMRIDVIEPYLPELLTWVQDGNWPVAEPLATALAKLGAPVVPSVLAVLSGTDAIWKYWCIELLVKRLSRDARVQMQDQLLSLAQSPSLEEKQEGVHIAAREALQKTR